MAYTVSCHFGSSYSLGHNRRDEEYIKNQEHIEKDGIHESIIDQSISDFYSQEFSSAVAEYNAREKHQERHIKSYLHKVRQDKKLNECYECIATIGNIGEHPEEPICRKVLGEFLEQWQTDNPNMKVVGAYYHADEKGAPHLHIDFVPVADFQKGLSHRNSYNKAIEQQDGYRTEKGKGTGQTQWQHKVRNTLRTICRNQGLDITLDKGEQKEHCDTELYKLQKDLKSIQFDCKLEQLRYDRKAERNKDLIDKIDQKESIVAELEEKINSLKKDAESLQEKVLEQKKIVSGIKLDRAKSEHLKAEITRLEQHYMAMLNSPPKEKIIEKVVEVPRYVDVPRDVPRYIDTPRYYDVPVEVPVEVEKIVEKEVIVEKVVESNLDYKDVFMRALNAFKALSGWVRDKGLSAESYTALSDDIDYLRAVKTLYPRNKARVAPLTSSYEDIMAARAREQKR